MFFLLFKLNPIKIGKTRRIQGDKIEITPVIKEINKVISTISPHILVNNSLGPQYPSIDCNSLLSLFKAL